MPDDWLEHWKELEAELESPDRETVVPSERPIEEQNKGAKDQEESAKNNQRDPSADFSALIDTIKKEGIAYRKEEQREDRGKKFREWTTIVLIAMTFGAVCWQVHEMIKVYGPIKLQADAAKVQANAAQKSAESASREADAAKAQAEAMTKQTETSAQAIVAAGRAWVGPRDARLESKPVAAKKNKAIVEYQNTGKEPAVGFVYTAFPFVVTAAEDTSGASAKTMLENMQKCINTQPAMLAGVVFPTSGFNAGNLTTSIDETLIDQDVVDGNKIIVMQGCFAYQTGNITHHSAFCFFYKADQTDIAHLNICRSGNYAD